MTFQRCFAYIKMLSQFSQRVNYIELLIINRKIIFFICRCGDEWFKMNATCPTCRKPIVDDVIGVINDMEGNLFKLFNICVP